MDITIWFNSSLRFFSKTTTLFSQHLFYAAHLLDAAVSFQLHHVRSTCLFIYLSDVRGRFGLNSFYSATATTLRRPTFSFRPISPYRSVLARINNHRFFDVNAMRGSRPMGSSPTLSCTESISHDDIDRICATQCNMWLFGDALLVSS